MEETAPYRRIFELAPHSFFLMDAQRQILMVNPSFCRAFGYRPRDVIGRQSIILFKRSQDHESFWHMAGHAQDTGHSEGMAGIVMRRRDGTDFPAQVWGPFLQEEFDQSPWFLGVARPMDLAREAAAVELSWLQGAEPLRSAIRRGDYLPMLLEQILAGFQAEAATLLRLDKAGMKIELGAGRWQSWTGRTLPDEGRIIRKRIEAGKIYTTIEPRELSRLGAVFTGDGIHALVCMPIAGSEHTGYALCLGRGQEFAPDELQALIAISNLLVAALRTNGSAADARPGSGPLVERLERLSTAILGQNGMPRALSEILDLVVLQPCVDAARILIWDGDSDSVGVVAARGFRKGHDWLKASPHFSADLRAHLGRRLRLEAAELGEDRPAHLPERLVSEEEFRTYLGIPLATEQRVLGILELFSRGSLVPGTAWPALLDGLAGQAAVALEVERLKRSRAGR